MLRSLKGTLNRRKDRKRCKEEHDPNQKTVTPPPRSSKDEELVIQTKESALTGGYSGTAIGGCGAAWTRSFNMTEATAAKKQREYTRPAVNRDASDNSLDLDVNLFLPEDGLPDRAPEDDEPKADTHNGDPGSPPGEQAQKEHPSAGKDTNCTPQQAAGTDKSTGGQGWAAE